MTSNAHEQSLQVIAVTGMRKVGSQTLTTHPTAVVTACDMHNTDGQSMIGAACMRFAKDMLVCTCTIKQH